MALVDSVSYAIEDFVGDRKTLQVFYASPNTIAGLQALVDVTAPLLDAAIDGKIAQITATFNLDIPAGLKGAAVAGNTVHEGALLSYDAADTIYTYSLYVPSWENAGFTGNVALTSGDYGAIETDLQQGTDRDANSLDALIGGKRKFRK